MLIENHNILRLKNRPLLDRINQHVVVDEKVVMEPSRIGDPTLKVNVNERYKYIHSKYDPNREASQIVGRFEITNETKHVIFFGAGLGYHIKLFIEKNPTVNFIIYEPNLDVLANLLDVYSFKKRDKVLNIIHDKVQLQNELMKISNNFENQIKVLALPAYQEIYKGELNELFERMIDLLKTRKNQLVTNISFQKRWTINAIKNFPSMLKTPNILKDIDRSLFEGIPAIIVAAGPSLNEEFENLRYIKKHRLAYIFAVGSANNSLVENGVFPDAICTYDPQAHNFKVIQKVKNKNIKTIPLIYGSTVGYETLYDYNGPLLHMITSQDTIAPTLLNGQEIKDIVHDAPSIALVTYQMLTILGVKTIYLVGQNLSFQNNFRYADGIEYGDEQIKQDKLFSVKSVNGDIVWTDEGYNRMRQQLESYINGTPNVEVYNTTNNGADIQGAPYISLDNVIKNHLTTKNQVPDKWFDRNGTYDINNVLENFKKLEQARNSFITLLNDLENSIKDIRSSKKYYIKNNIQMEKKFAKFDKKFKKMKNNIFYSSFLAPMLRVQLEKLSEGSKNIKFQTCLSKKIDLFESIFGNFINQLVEHHQAIDSYFYELQEFVELEQKEVNK